MKRHPTPLVWFRFHSGDLPLVAWLRFRAHVAGCRDCGARLTRERAERAGVEALLDEARPAGPRTARPWLGLSLAGAAAVAALVFLLVRPRPNDAREALDDDPGVLRAKGGSSFVVHVAAVGGDGGVDVLGPRCRPGDALQARFASDKRHLLVVGVDPDGTTRTLLPLDGATSARIAPGEASVPQSWVLDAVRGRERFVAFFSDAPLDAAQAHAAALAETPRLAGAVTIVRECTKAAP